MKYKVSGEYLVGPEGRHWIGDLSRATRECIVQACEDPAATDARSLGQAIDELVDATPGAEPVYLSMRRE
jgi:hypothetical protein